MGRRTLLLTASILVAALGTAMIWLYVRSADERARGGQELVAVLEATDGIEGGLAAAQLATKVKVVQMAVSAAPQDRVLTLTDLKDQVTKQPIYAGQPLIKAQFGAAAGGSSIPDGRMGVAVSLDDPNRVAGLLRPDAKIAVYLVVAPGQGKGSTDLLLPEVRVIAIGATTATSTGTQSKSTVATAVVTLDVTGRDAARLMLAQRSGELYFTLLGKNAKGSTTDDVTASTLLNG